jgi:hypothetical protein
MPLIDLSRQTNLTVDSDKTLSVSGILDVNTFQIDGTEVTATAAELNQLSENIFTAGVAIGSNGAAQDLTVWGDFTVKGDSVGLDVATYQVEDPVIQLNYTGGAAASGADSGFEVGRNGTNNAILQWDESATDWIFGDSVTSQTIAGKTDLASTSASKGASMIGIQDASAIITATTVEGALDENRAAIDAIEDNTISLSVGAGFVTGSSSSGTVGADNQTLSVAAIGAGTYIDVNANDVDVDTTVLYADLDDQTLT